MKSLAKTLILVNLIMTMNSLINIPLQAQSSIVNVINVDLPFMEICANTRMGALGEISVVSSSFYTDGGLFDNPALFSKSKRYAGTNISYMPWLRNIVGDLYVSEGSGYFSLNAKNSIGYNFRYFNIGDYTFYDNNGNELNTSTEKELYHQISYGHAFSKNFSFGMALKYIKSDLRAGYHDPSYPGKIVKTYAIDLGTEYESDLNLSANSLLHYHWGVSISNFGPKVRYSENPEIKKSFIPTTLKLGFLINPDFYLSDQNRLNIDMAYEASKLLVPTSPFLDEYGTIVKGKDPDISPFQALYQSFYDAPDGMKEEFHEITHRIGIETRLNFGDIFYGALRMGKSMNHKTKGNININTMGVGIGCYGFTLDFRKIFANHSPLDKTWSITLGFRTRLDKVFRF